MSLYIYLEGGSRNYLVVSLLSEQQKAGRLLYLFFFLVMVKVVAGFVFALHNPNFLKSLRGWKYYVFLVGTFDVVVYM